MLKSDHVVQLTLGWHDAEKDIQCDEHKKVLPCQDKGLIDYTNTIGEKNIIYYTDIKS